MVSILAIQSAIATAYTQIVLPSALTATALTVESDDNFDAVLPAVIVFRGITLNTVRRSRTEYMITREFIARLYTGALDRANDAPSVKQALLEYAASTVEPVEDYFMTIDSNLGLGHVTESLIRADVADTDLFSRDNRTYIGSAFSHVVTYIRRKT